MTDRRQSRPGARRARGPSAGRRPAWLRVVDIAAALAIVLLASPTRPQVGGTSPPASNARTDAAHPPGG